MASSPGSNPPGPIPLVQRQPTRLLPSGLITLGAVGSATATITIPGSDKKQDRLQIVITNMDPALYLLWGTPNGQVAGAIFAQLPWTLEVSFDVMISNPNGSPVNLYVGEIYPDTGNQHGVPLLRAQANGSPGAGGAGGTGGTGGTGGSGGGTSGGGGASGGSSGFGGGGSSSGPSIQ